MDACTFTEDELDIESHHLRYKIAERIDGKLTEEDMSWKSVIQNHFNLD